MKRMTILVPNAQTGPNTVSCIVGAYHVFNEANNYHQKKTGKARFKIEMAGISNQTAFMQGLLSVTPQVGISSIRKTDLILIPAITGNPDKIDGANMALADRIMTQYKKGAEVASMCAGAYILAATGLLEGKNCSVHWNSAENFKKLFPDVNLKVDKLITDEDGIYTNGGGYSFLNLLIYLVEKYCDRQTAIFCSKIFQIDMDRQTQSDFIIFKGQKSHGDDTVKKAQQYIETHFDDAISIEKLSKKMGVGRRSFDRRFLKSTGNTPVEYHQRVRIEFAKKAFESTQKSVKEVMYESGYSDVKAFREVFRKITGISPVNYKQKYNKEALIF